MNDTPIAQRNRVTIRVWGDFACFTRPEMKVERVSYPVITPSAARGILEAIYWEPQMYYLIDRIHIIKRGHWISIRRNEVINVISMDNAKGWMNRTRQVTPIQAGGGASDGTQRNMLALQDVEYLITAEVRLTELLKQRQCNISKYLAQIQRRASCGKCFHRPAFGVREFDVNFSFEEAGADAAYERRKKELAAIKEPFEFIKYEPLGLMLYDVFDYRGREQGFRWFREEEIASNYRQFESSIANLKKGDQSRRRKEYYVSERHFDGRKIQPRLTFFQAEIRDSVMCCHPDKVKILIQDIGGKN
jgi:CRISPR-associated protein Cas5d